MSSEETFYSKDGVLITNKRAVFKDKTYAMRNVTSVSKGMVSAPIGGPFALMGMGLCGIMVGMVMGAGDWTEGVPAAAVGAVMAGLGGFWMIKSKPTMVVQFHSSSGEIKALSSKDADRIDAIIAAINEAIIHGVE